MPDRQRTFHVCQGTGCVSGGAEQIYSSLEAELARLNLGESTQIKRTGCHGFCQRGPLVVIEPEAFSTPRLNRMTYLTSLSRSCRKESR